MNVPHFFQVTVILELMHRVCCYRSQCQGNMHVFGALKVYHASPSIACACICTNGIECEHYVVAYCNCIILLFGLVVPTGWLQSVINCHLLTYSGMHDFGGTFSITNSVGR